MDERRMGSDEELVRVRHASKGLNRRVLLGGLAAGAAGLRVPRSGAAAPLNLAIRIEVVNQEWGTVPLSFWTYRWGHDGTLPHKFEETSLGRNATKAFKSTSDRNAVKYKGAVLIDGKYYILFINPDILAPSFDCLLGGPNGKTVLDGRLKPDQSQHWRLDGDKQILITRRKDSAEFKEFLVELKKANAKTVPLR